MSEGQVAATAIFFGLVVIGLVAGGLYYAGAFPVFGEWWEQFKASQATRNARNEQVRLAQQREREIGIETTWLPASVLEGAIEAMTRSNWGTESRTSSTVTFARHEGADNCLGCLLMLFLLIPGILYLLLAQKTVRVTLAAYPHATGSRVVIGGDEPRAMGWLAEWVRGLPIKTDGAKPPPLEKPPPPPSLAPEPKLVSRMRELSELKEAGLITQEEYDAKRAELLRRM